MLEKTAVNIKPEGEKEAHMFFEGREHELFYYEKLKRAGQSDCHRQALIYLLGISEITRKHFRQIHDIKSGCINPECLNHAWQTSGSRRIVRLAFNLYTDNIPGGESMESEEEKLDEYRQYSAGSIFRCDYARCFWEGIRLRYPEYVGGSCH